jgi:hypothetical protein
MRGENQAIKKQGSLRTRLTKQEALRTTTRIQLKGVKLAKPELDRVNSALSSGNVPIRLSGSRGKYSLKVEVDGKTILCPATDVSFDRRLKEFPDEDILGLCRKYYDALALLVKECGEKFDT